MRENRAMNWQGQMLGRYQLLRLIGRGGMGEVWQAEDTRFRRQVAIKLLPAVLRSEQSYLRMFERDARAAAALDHPHILQVHDFGEAQIGQDEIVTFLVMPYIRAGTLRERLRAANGPLSPEEGLHYLKHAAEAIDFAHSKQVIHRDIKPANMLLNGDWLLLADFGIARLLTSDTYRSRTSAGAGTPEYIAPEQAQGKAMPASDRYSLGVVAYAVFAGHLPFEGGSTYEILLKQITTPPPPPRQFNPAMPAKVESVILKALAKQPAARYQSCSEFVEALERAWRGLQLAPGSDPDATSLAPWSRRIHEVDVAAQPTEKTPAVTPVPFMTPELAPQTQIMAPMQVRPSQPSMVPAPPYAQYPAMQTQSNIQTAISHSSSPTQFQQVQERPAERQQPEERQRKIGRREVVIGGAAAVAVVAVGGTAATTLLLNKPSTPTPPRPTPTPIPGPRQFAPGKPLLNLTGHSDTVTNVVWDSTGRYLATAGQDTRVMLWDLGGILQKNPTTLQAIDQPAHKWKLKDAVSPSCLHWTSDGRRLVLSNLDSGQFGLLDPFTDGSKPQIFTDSASKADSFNRPDYFCVVSRPHSPMLASIELTLPQKIKVNLWQMDKPGGPVGTLTYDDPETKPDHPVGLLLIDWSRDGSLLAGLTESGRVVLWDIKTSAVKTAIAMPDRTQGKTVNVNRVAMSWSPANPDLLAVFNIDTIAVVDIRQGKTLYQLGTDDKTALTPPKDTGGIPWVPHIESLTWSPNGRYIAAAYARNHQIYVWDLQATDARTGKDGVRFQQYLFPAQGDPAGHTNTIYDLAWSPDGRYLATGSFDKTVIVWKVDAL
ncbi:MAG: protein kinase [Ktedonobacteraceae bacterium]|nr:protein kinase [Ktedonobacteraceae bacterium]